MNRLGSPFWLLLFLGGLILVTSVRFDYLDPEWLQQITGEDEFSYTFDNGTVIEGLPPDVYQYTTAVRYFRGYDLADELRVPFVYRPMLPILASFLPFDPMTSLNILNVAFLWGGLIFLWLTMMELRISLNSRIISSALYVFSFPVFYYGAIGYVDPALVGILCFGVWQIITGRYKSLLATIFLGVLIKETVVLLIPVILVWFIFSSSPSNKMKITWIILYGLAFLLMMFLVRWWSPHSVPHAWLPTLDILIANLSRPRTYIAFAITAGVPFFAALIAAWLLRKETLLWPNWLPLIAGLVITCALFLYSMLSAYSDGRFIWPAYAFTIPLTGFVIDYFLKSRDKL